MTKQSRHSLMPDFRRLYGYGPEDTYCGSCSLYREHTIERRTKGGVKLEEKYQTCALTLIGRERRYDGDPPEWDESERTCTRYEKKG